MILAQSAVFHTASRHALAWSLLLWLLILGVSLSFRDGPYDHLAEISYQMATGLGLMALAWFGVLNIPHGLIADFSVGQIMLTGFALGLGGYGAYVALSVLPLPYFLLAAGLLVLGEASIVAWLKRAARRQARKEAARPIIEPTLRGSGAVLETGPDGVRFVARNETGRNTPAERFEQRLIRHIERSLEREVVSMAGTNASYWRFLLPDRSHTVELSVLGPGYNTAGQIRTGERWLLRIREPKPCAFIPWIEEHFPTPGCGVVRNLGHSQQVQFSSSLLDSDNSFFDNAPPWPQPEPQDDEESYRHEGQWTLRVLRVQAAEEAEAEADDEGEHDDDSTTTKKPTLH